VPTFLTGYVDYYIDNVRTYFPRSSDTPRLWLNWYGKPMSGHSVYLRMVEVTEKYIGKALNPHIFRDCAATFLSWEDPGAASAAQGLLGHRTRRTTDKHYTHARQIEAARKINDVLKGLVDNGKQPVRNSS
jgi:site-specific recombinase XerD